jgi:hypothetical protein
MRDVISFRLRAMAGCLELRVLQAVRCDVFLAPPRPRPGVQPASVVDPQQETLHVKTAVPSELQMPLLDPGSLLANPRIARACARCGQIDGHVFHDEGSCEGVSQAKPDRPR